MIDTFGDCYSHCLSSHMKHNLKNYTIYIRFSMFIIFTIQLLKVEQLEFQKSHTIAFRILMLLSVSTFYSLVSDGFHLLETLLLVL